MTTAPEPPIGPYPPLDRDELRRVAELADRRQRLREAQAAALIRRACPGWTDTEQTD